jgi:hypothetical protein
METEGFIQNENFGNEDDELNFESKVCDEFKRILYTKVNLFFYQISIHSPYKKNIYLRSFY